MQKTRSLSDRSSFRRASMNSISLLTTSFLIGIFELNTAGTVLYSRQSHPDELTEKKYLVGENFFEQVADFENAADFHCRFKKFICSHHSMEKFSFEFRSVKETVPVKVLMIRTREKNESQVNDIVILDIRKREV